MQVEAVRVAASERGAGLGQALLAWAVDVGRPAALWWRS